MNIHFSKLTKMNTNSIEVINIDAEDTNIIKYHEVKTYIFKINHNLKSFEFLHNAMIIDEITSEPKQHYVHLTGAISDIVRLNVYKDDNHGCYVFRVECAYNYTYAVYGSYKNMKKLRDRFGEIWLGVK
jgi:hypothetical protein